MGSRVTFAGLTEARARVALLAEALQRAASGEVIERAAAKVAERVQRIALPRVEAHSDSGHALGALSVAITGSLVTIDAPAYLRMHSFWPFRRGMPATVATYAAQVLAAILLEILGDSDGAGRMLALQVLEEQAAGIAKKAAAEQEKIARRAAKKGRRA